MRICIAHNRYLCPGGEDAVVDSEAELLRSKGHEVGFITADNAGITGFWGKVGTALRVHYSKGFMELASKEIASFKPDIMHVHNFFPLITPSVYDACKDAGVKVVQTLHNFRSICAGALLMRAGRPCEECIEGSAYNGALHGCYRDSLLGSLAVSRMVEYHKKRGTWQDKVDAFIALTDFSRSKFIAAGFPPDRITVKPNFVVDPSAHSTPSGPREGVLFVGRLSQEKGIKTLMEAWAGLDIPLKVLGDGPLMPHKIDKGLPAVKFLGHVSAAAVKSEMKNAAFLVMPSICYEGLPMTLIESFSHGLPVIASRLGGMLEIIKDGVTGLHFEAGDARDLADKVRWAAANPAAMHRMGANARAAYIERYAPDASYGMLIGIYERLLTGGLALPVAA